MTTAVPVLDQPAPPPPPAPPAAPPAAVASAMALGACTALFLPGGPPGVGVGLLALLVAGVLLALRPAAPRTGWQAVHGVAALLLAGAAAVRDAPWLVALDMVAALGLGSLALVPAGTWPGVLLGLARVIARVLPASGWLVRGLRPVLARSTGLGPVARGLALTAGLLVVFVPLLVSADASFSALLGRLVPDEQSLGLLPLRAVVLVLGTCAAAAALHVVLMPVDDPSLPAASRRLTRTSEWLPPLAALDLLLGVFLAVQAELFEGSSAVVRSDTGATYAGQVHAGFWQLVAVTALVLVVVAAAVRWTPVTRGVRAALALLCALTLVVDASALMRLHAYTDAYGLTRLRIGVAVISLALGAVLVVVLIAGARSWSGHCVAHVAMLVVAAALLSLTASDPDAAIARSALARGPDADTDYLATLSADAVPVLVALPEPRRSCVLRVIAADLIDSGWTSANVARSRATRTLRELPAATCRVS